MISALIGRVLGVRACSLCGTRVKHRAVKFETKKQKRPDRHSAPCGALCVMGGLTGADMRGSAIHGLPSESCPHCGYMAMPTRHGG